MGWGNTLVLAGAAAMLLSACASAPEAPQAAADPVAVCHAMFDSDAEIQQELARSGADGDTLCACFASEYDALAPEARANMIDLSATVIEVREANGFSTVEEAVELMEDDRDGAAYGFPWDRLKAGGEPIEEAILRARREPAGGASNLRPGRTSAMSKAPSAKTTRSTSTSVSTRPRPRISCPSADSQ